MSFWVLIWVLAITNITVGVRLIFKGREIDKEIKEMNTLLDQVKELRESWDRDVRTHFIPTPEWHGGWMWN